MNDQGQGSYSSVDVDILHKDYGGEYNIRTAFLNPLLMEVSEVISVLLTVLSVYEGVCCDYPRA